jgi:hypothetical protein
MSPPAPFSPDKLIECRADVFLIDWELSKAGVGKTPISYQGSTVAASIHENLPEHPVILFTRKSLTGAKYGTALGAARDTFDDILLKGEVEKAADRAARKLEDLGVGYRLLRRKRRRDWRSVAELLRARPAEADALQKAGPPLLGPAAAGPGAWQVKEIAAWIRQVLLGYPGILYDDLYAATVLGISLESFRHPRVARYFSRARYSGVFGGFENRWWKGRALEIAHGLLRVARSSGSIHSGFAPAYTRRFSVTLDPARCVECGKPTADSVCYVLKEPVHRIHSLPYYPDFRPAFMEEARVSFKVIRETDKVSDELFGASARGELKAIRGV